MYMYIYLTLRLTIDVVGGRCEWAAVRPNWSALSGWSSGRRGRCECQNWSLIHWSLLPWI